MYQKANKAKIADYTGPISLSITLVMPITTNIHQARTIPDSRLRKVAHDAELDQLDDIKAIIYVDITPPPHLYKAIPMTTTYRYKRDQDGNITERKDRISLRGDLMAAHVHYNPDEVSTFMAEKFLFEWS